MNPLLHFSQFAGDLMCVHCGATNKSGVWPVNGDTVVFTYQEEPGEFSLEIDCPDCKKKWYVVWDYYPGKHEPLFGSR